MPGAPCTTSSTVAATRDRPGIVEDLTAALREFPAIADALPIRSTEQALGVWGAPDGNPDATTRTAKLVVETFREHSFTVEWDGSGATRPVLDLRER